MWGCSRDSLRVVRVERGKRRRLFGVGSDVVGGLGAGRCCARGEGDGGASGEPAEAGGEGGGRLAVTHCNDTMRSESVDEGESVRENESDLPLMEAGTPAVPCAWTSDAPSVSVIAATLRVHVLIDFILRWIHRRCGWLGITNGIRPCVSCRSRAVKAESYGDIEDEV